MDFEKLYLQLDEYVKSNVSEHRYRHTMGVVRAAEVYAKRFGSDVCKARIAAIFHDACKSAGPLEHGPAAAKLLKEKFSVDDEDILNAITFHTVGRANMSLLEMVIKCADLTEEGRTYPSAERFRNRLLSEDNIKAVLYDMMLEIKSHIEAQGEIFNESSQCCVNWLKGEIGEKMSNKELAVFTAKFLDEKKAADICIIDISEKSGFADYFVIATASSNRQLEALSDMIEDKLAENSVLIKHVEGDGNSGWILLDFGDLIINLFSEAQRNRYQLEKVWGDCNKIDFQ